MGWKSDLCEAPLWLLGKCASTQYVAPKSPESIFVLRNNDIGDLLVTTPLLEALRNRFPAAKIVAGIGAWNADVLQNNPHVSEVVLLSAPWKNKYSGVKDDVDEAKAAIRYIFSSPEVTDLANRKFDIGIDVFGSIYGSLLLLKTGVPYRMGVRGYRGGHSSMSACVAYSASEHVSRANLRFAEILGATELPKPRPQLFLSDVEVRRGEELWARCRPAHAGRRFRIVVGPSAGLPEKRWPLERYAELVRSLGESGDVSIAIVGAQADRSDGDELAKVTTAALNMAGSLTLRETFALVSACDLVFCNSSMLLHVAGAFSKPTVVFTGHGTMSPEAHDKLWGYQGTCVSLGQASNGAPTVTPDEAIDAARILLSRWGTPLAGGVNQ